MRYLVEGLMEVAHAEPARDVVANHARHERRIEHVVHQATQHEDLQPEDGARDGRAEDSGEAGADAADHELAPIAPAEPEKGGEPRSERSPDLRGGTFLAHGPAHSNGEHGGGELYRRHQE